MAAKSSFVQVRQTSSAQVTEEGGRGMEGRVTASSDLTITVDFPLAITHQVDLPKSSSIDPVRDMKSFDNSVTENLTQQRQVVPIVEKVVEYCDKFSQDTTCHGMHTVCARNVTIFRRYYWYTMPGFLWILVIMTCLTVFGFIVRERFIYFISKPNTINFERVYEKRILFPAVTICNENQYSISKAFNLQLNEILMDMVYSDSFGDKHPNIHDEIRLNELNTMLGSNLENMLLSCQWHEGFHCGLENFTEIITDGGRCYTFNGQETDTVLDVHSTGSEKGVRFLINTEEYERMPLSSMSAGLRLLIHDQGVYPLVKQLGQSVAPGNHAFISLQLKKETRLGPPYDNCHDGKLRFIPDRYRYTLPACQTECYFAHTLAKCGCSDFFIPANFSSCTLAQYDRCLRKIQRTYPVIEQKSCDCRKPCNTKYISADYSYGSLSELAFETLKQETLDNIRERHRKAVDIYQFISRETQYKKHIFYNFTLVLDRAKELYSSDLNILETRFTRTLNESSKKYLKLCDTIHEILWEQSLIIKKGFVQPVRRMDRTTIDRVIDDMDMIATRVQNLVRDHVSSPSNDTRLRYTVLMDDLRARTGLLDATLRNFNAIKYSFSSGLPLSNLSFSKHQTKHMSWNVSTVMPRKLLRKAISHDNVSKLKISIENISSSLTNMMEMVEKCFETKEKNYNIHQLEEAVTEFTENCDRYIVAKETFLEETVWWPLQEIRQKSATYRESKLSCDFHFKAILGTIQKETVRLGVSLASAKGYFSKLGKALNDYLANFNVSNFDIADLVLGEKFMLAASDLDAVSHEMRDNVNHLYGLLNNVVDCLDDNLKRIMWDEALSDLLEVMSGDIGVSVTNLSKDISVSTYDIQKSFMGREESSKVSFRLLELSNTIITEYRKFADSTKIDMSFYRRNFIFLDIFFGDISYTKMKQQKVYSGYDLFSDIGGSMGLLVGASVISLLEIMDLFCLLSIAVCRK